MSRKARQDQQQAAGSLIMRLIWSFAFHHQVMTIICEFCYLCRFFFLFFFQFLLNFLMLGVAMTDNLDY